MTVLEVEVQADGKRAEAGQVVFADRSEPAGARRSAVAVHLPVGVDRRPVLPSVVDPGRLEAVGLVESGGGEPEAPVAVEIQPWDIGGQRGAWGGLP